MALLTTTVAFTQELRGGTEPAGSTITLRVDATGFHDAGGIGGGGQVVEPVAVDRVAELLKTEYGLDDLRAVLAHFTALAAVLEA